MTPSCIWLCLQSSFLTISLGESMDNLSDSFSVSTASQALVNQGDSEWELGRREENQAGWACWGQGHWFRKYTVTPYTLPFKLQTFKDANMRSINVRHEWNSSLPSPISSPPVGNSSCLFTWCQPLYASCCIVLLYFSRYYTVRLKSFPYFLCLFFNVLFVWKVL